MPECNFKKISCSANILLDANMKPYIGDFGLVTEGPIPTLTHMTVMSVNGTKPYLPFDYLQSRQISTKVDTYSFGIVSNSVTLASLWLLISKLI
jgi:serine/threonine protein kinase